MNAQQFRFHQTISTKLACAGKRKHVTGSVSWVGAGFTWLQAGLLHGSLGGSNGYPSILKVGLSDAALALASGGAMGTQLAVRGRLRAAWAAV